jgi:hypothetical protein
VQSDPKYRAFRSKLSEENDDADVEDEIDEKNSSNGISKPKKRTPDMSSRDTCKSDIAEELPSSTFWT